MGSKVNQEKFRELRISYQEAGRLKAREGRPLHLAGCMLYWAEGSKERNRFEFVNADPYMMRLFIRFLREEMEIDEAIINIRVHCHSNDPDEKQRTGEYWAQLLGLPLTSLRRMYHKQGGEVREKLPNGVCGIRVESTELVQHIYGAIQEYGGFENPAWAF